MWFGLWFATASAQVFVDGESPNIDAQLFRPSLDSQYTLWTNDSTKFKNHALMGRFTAHYTKEPLVYRQNSDAPDIAILSDIVQLDAAGGYQLGPLRMGLNLPLYLFTDGEGRSSSGGVGDLTVDLKGTLLDRNTKNVGLALGGRLGLPTSSMEGVPLGSDGLTYEIEGILDKDLGEKFFGALNVGYRGIPDVELENIEWQDAVYAKVGLGYKMSPSSGLSAELISHAVNQGLDTSAGIPAEVMLGGWGRAAKGLKLRGGVGTSLSQGIAAPEFRAVFAMSFEPNTDPDTDGDGIVDFDDDCKTVPEDKDGFEDLDGCPESTAVKVMVVDDAGTAIPGAKFNFTSDAGGAKAAGETVELDGGDYPLEVMAAGYTPVSQTATIPNGESHEITVTMSKDVIMGKLKVNITDADGNPIEGANWSDGTAPPKRQDSGNSIDTKVGAYRVRVAAPHYRTRVVDATVEDGKEKVVTVELQPARAELEGEQITIKDSVYFEVGKATIKPESYELLTEIAEIMVDHDEITLLRIEGHTDSRGSAESNKLLSTARAASVKDFLAGKGVEASRLESAGFGEEKPLDPAENEAAWAKNRRVDFFVAGRR